MLINGSITDFTLLSDKGEATTISEEATKYDKLVIYFYPKDDTPGCTTEAKEFSSLITNFEQHKTGIIGISPDKVSSHANFIKKYDIKFPLLSDHAKEVSIKLGVLQEKSMFGKKYMGIVRSTFLIDRKLNIIKSWENVKVKNHAQKILDFIQKV